MGSSHPSKGYFALALAAAFACACSRDSAVVARTVTMHAPGACAPGVLELDGGAYVTYTALGDFEASAVPSPGHVAGRIGEGLPEIDDACRTLVVDAVENDATWSGVGGVAPVGDVDVLLLPSLRSCALSFAIGPRTGSTLAPSGTESALLVGGVDSAGDPSPTYVLHLDTGAIAVADPDLLKPRTGASVTSFGAGALVAGGTDPRAGGSLRDSAEVYASATGGFAQQNPILLSTARTYHGAVELATGETLLVGGVGGQDGQTVLDSMEIVDPVTQTVRAENIAHLAVARRSPDVLRLASGEILVAGGFDGAGNPVSTLEWFSSGATAVTKRPRELVSGLAHAFVALEAGGALAVITPPPNADANFQNVWVIGADGSFSAAAPIAGTLAQPVLFGGAGGAPALWTGDRWLRWQPWIGSFASLGVLDDAPAAVSRAAASPDPGLALWLDSSGSLITGLRFDVRSPYSPLSGPRWVPGGAAAAAETASDTSPDGLVTRGGAAFDPSVGMVLAPGSSAFVTDRTYGDIAIDVDAPTGEPGVIVLRDQWGGELEVGGVGCPFALSPSAPSMHVRRTGSTVEWSFAAGPAGTCATALRAGARVAIGVRGPAQATRAVAANLRITRLGAR